MLKIATKLLASAGISAIAFAQPAAAQTDGAEQGKSDSNIIIVTAQKREQSLQDVPIALTAYSGEELTERGAADINEAINFTPGLSGATKASFSDTFSVRGISTSDFGIGGDPSFGVFRNGVYAGRTGEVFGSFFDLERVEVLRGPQGLLFGRGAASGAISVVTAKADPSALSGDFNIGTGQRGQFRIGGNVNIPLSEDAAFRLAATHSQEDGFVQNVLNGDELINHDRYAIRGSLTYDPASPFHAYIVAEYEDREQSPVTYLELDLTGQPTSGDPYVIASDVSDDVLTDESQIFNLSAELGYDFDSVSLTSITAFRSHEFDYIEDFDGSAFDLFQQILDQEGHYFSQEFRLVSSAENRLRWFVGASGFYDYVEQDIILRSDEETLCFLFAGADCATAFGVPFTANPQGYVESGRGEGETWGLALYGDLAYDITDNFTISLGARLGYDKRDFTLISNPIVSEVADNFGRLELQYGFQTTNPVVSSDSWTNLSPRLLLEYKPNDDTLIFGSVSKGFKPGAFDTFTVDAITPGFPSATEAPGANVNSVDPEEVLSYEVGLRGALGSIGTFSISGYYYDYTELQQLIRVGAAFNLVNVGNAEGYGIEGEFKIEPSRYFDFSGNFAWANTEVKNIGLNVCTSATGGSCAGNDLPFSPEFTLGAQANVYYPIVDGEWELFATAEVNYSDSFFGALDNHPLTLVDSFTEVNFRAGVKVNDRATLRFFVENAFNSEHFDQRFFFADLPLALGIGPARPRTWGVDLSISFGD